ncbi:hypothetical protein [Inhella proteolytica]|uniref:Uncharacterized protein n=1 Tax=Inhella proteolytica TaxID=2795029 RepID=A0A931NID9_9BURK|nr:hypothetical protein [Inhella proteolytica]MBH9579241.1 hypothetical protein [Inhella proteolytica]
MNETRPAPAHEGALQIGALCNRGPGAPAEHLTARVAQYPGCQQLQVWLPRPGWQGYERLSLQALEPEGLIEEAPVGERLSGSVQLLFDTLAWPPGAYRLRIAHAEGWAHELELRKLDGPAPAPPPAAPEPPAETPIRYRDGLGRPLPDEDLLLRLRLLERLQQRFARRVEIQGTPRAGQLLYAEPGLHIAFDYEMGAQPCQMRVLLPSAAQWAAQTGCAPERREEILQFLAERLDRQQGWRHEISEREIAFY